MAQFEGVKVEVSPQLRRLLNGRSVFDALERNAPRAMMLLGPEIRARAPRGKTGMLGRMSLETRVRRISGLAGGIEVTLLTRVPYAHLVESGHRIIPRGRTRFTSAARTLQGNRKLRASERRALKARRKVGGFGFVPGRHFVAAAWRANAQRVVNMLERLLAQQLSRAA